MAGTGQLLSCGLSSDCQTDHTIRLERNAAGVVAFFARKAETLLNDSIEIDLEKELPEVNHEIYDLVLRALEEVTRAIEISDTQPESWNECPTWRDWGIVKSGEILDFWHSLEPVFSGARKS